MFRESIFNHLTLSQQNGYIILTQFFIYIKITGVSNLWEIIRKCPLFGFMGMKYDENRIFFCNIQKGNKKKNYWFLKIIIYFVKKKLVY